MFYIIHQHYNITKMYTVLQNVFVSTTSNTLMYLTINYTHLHYYIWLQIHITLTMNLRNWIIFCTVVDVQVQVSFWNPCNINSIYCQIPCCSWTNVILGFKNNCVCLDFLAPCPYNLKQKASTLLHSQNKCFMFSLFWPHILHLPFETFININLCSVKRTLCIYFHCNCLAFCDALEL